MVHRRWHPFALLVVAVAVIASYVGAAALAASPAAAALPELAGQDISWPQCPAGSGTAIPGTSYGTGYGNPMPPTTTDFVIIGLTDGLPFYRNHCLASQVQFVDTFGLRTGAYTMAGYPTSAQLSRYGDAGPRTGTTLTDRLFNTGYAMAAFDLASMRAVGLSVPFVWIDVETRSKAPTPPNWPSNTTTNNRAVLAGIAAGFANAGLGTGWYSVQTSWKAITGNWLDKTPMWKAGNYDDTLTGYARARSICSTSPLNGGPIWAAQAVSGSSDLDVTCPALPSYNTVFRPGTAGVSALAPATSWAQAGGGAAGTLSWQARLGATQDWSATLADGCTATTVHTFTGRNQGTVTVRWDGTTASGASAPVGLYQLRFTSAGITRTATAELTSTGTRQLHGCPVWRSYGADRYATSTIVGQLAAPASGGTTTPQAVLASGETAHLVDGLVSAPLAAALGAPVLLTMGDQLPDAVAADLRARGVQEVYVVGGAVAVGEPVRAALRAAGMRVVPVYGDDRYATSVAVARAVVAAGGGRGGTAWLASGADGHLVDGLAAGGPAAAGRQPILLTRADRLPDSVAGQLQRMGTTRTYVLGGTNVISTGVAGTVPGAVRLAGADRYATAARVAATMAAGTPAVLACGEDAHLVDALPGGAAGRPILLARAGSLPTPTRDELASSRPTTVTLLGGPVVLSPAVTAAVIATLQTSG